MIIHTQQEAGKVQATHRAYETAYNATAQGTDVPKRARMIR